MAVVLVDRTVKVAKESDEVLALVVQLVKTVRTGGDVTSLVPALITAIDGVSNVDDEISEALGPVLNAVSTRLGEVVAALMTPKVVSPIQKV
jgi:hypothetical protein